MKMIMCVLYVHENVSTILFPENTIGEVGYVIISFQSCRISFYIEIPRRFRLLLIDTTKQQSHGK
jgi:hypothetical protein